ncbi:MAG: pantoate--beta-alanine ligase [Cryomorphaceae bacterium]|nr:pantoate--beta-alanine ligase [Cryomorphaceae bacterium]
MIVISKKTEVHTVLDKKRQSGSAIGFVPTMGALHDGHLSLIREAMRATDELLVSIFVNPTQFNSSADLDKYPRQLENDLLLLKSAAPHAMVFAPEVEEMYPPKEVRKAYDLGELDAVMEGARRPGHFQGVAAIVDKLFQLSGPCKAFFGEKDFQQLAIIRHMAAQYHPNVDVYGVPTRRESDGLAMSSRNMLLTPVFRAEAPVIYQSMLRFARNVRQEGIETCLKEFVASVEKNGLLKVEYAEVARNKDLKPVKEFEDDTRFFTAVFAGDVRLIDNVSLS